MVPQLPLMMMNSQNMFTSKDFLCPFLFKTSINSGLLFRGGTRYFYPPKIVFGTS